MGLTKWLARRLAVGGTARTFAKQYIWLRKNKYQLNAPDELVFNDIIMFRFKYPHSKELLAKISEGKIKGLKDLVVETLAIEAGYYDNDANSILIFEEVIEEELMKKGIPKHSI